MQKHLRVVLVVAGLSILPVQANAWRGGGFHAGAGGFTSWHHAGYGGGGQSDGGSATAGICHRTRHRHRGFRVAQWRMQQRQREWHPLL